MVFLLVGSTIWSTGSTWVGGFVLALGVYRGLYWVQSVVLYALPDDEDDGP